MSDVVESSLDGTADEAKVFLSYSRKDRERAQGIADALRTRHFGVFKDTDDILPTEEWRDRLQQLIEEADTIVFLLSPHSAVSEVCTWEVEYAVSLNKRIAPIVIEDVEGDLIPPLLARLNFIFCTPRDPFENAVDTLISALNTDIDWIREHTRLSGLVRRWRKSAEAKRLLLRGQDIVDAERWRDSRPANAPSVLPDQGRFIAASRAAAGRRLRITVLATALLSVMMGGLAALALSQSRDIAQRAAVLSADAARQISAQGDPDGALSILLEAAQAFDDDTAPHSVLLAFDDVLQRALAETRFDLPRDTRLVDTNLGFVLAANDTLMAPGPTGAPAVFAQLDGPLVAAQAAGDALLVVSAIEDAFAFDRFREIDGIWQREGLARIRLPDVDARDVWVNITPDGRVSVSTDAGALEVDPVSGAVAPDTADPDPALGLDSCVAGLAEADATLDALRDLYASAEYGGTFDCVQRGDLVLFTLFEVPNAGVIRKTYVIEDAAAQQPRTDMMLAQVAGDIRTRNDPAMGWAFVDFADPVERTLRLHGGDDLETEAPDSFAFEARIRAVRFVSPERLALLLDDKGADRGQFVVLDLTREPAYRPRRQAQGPIPEAITGDMVPDTLAYAGDFEVTEFIPLPDPDMAVVKLHIGMSQVEAWMYSLQTGERWRKLGRNHNFVDISFDADGRVYARDYSGRYVFDGLHSLSEAVSAARNALPEKCRVTDLRTSPCWPAGFAG